MRSPRPYLLYWPATHLHALVEIRLLASPSSLQCSTGRKCTDGLDALKNIRATNVYKCDFKCTIKICSLMVQWQLAPSNDHPRSTGFVPNQLPPDGTTLGMQAGNTAGSLKAQSHHKIYTSNRESVGLDLLGKTGHTRRQSCHEQSAIKNICVYIHIMISLDSHLSLSRSTVYVQCTVISTVSSHIFTFTMSCGQEPQCLFVALSHPRLQQVTTFGSKTVGRQQR